MKELVKGLRLLNQSDPCVEIYVQENGEHILCTAGEVHLQRCIDDLEQRFAMVPVNVSPPIIPFRETIIPRTKSNEQTQSIQQKPTQSQADEEDSKQTEQLKNKETIGPDGRIEIQSSDKRIKMCLKAKPLPNELTKFLEENIQAIKLLSRLNQNKLNANQNLDSLHEFKKNLKSKLDLLVEEQTSEEKFDWRTILDRIVSFGPNRYGPNILVNLIDDNEKNITVWSVLNELASRNLHETLANLELSPKVKNSSLFNEYENSITFGFNLFTAKGPICEEPVHGVAILIEKFQVDEQIKLNESLTAETSLMLNEEEDDAGEKIERKFTKAHTTQCISLMKEGCKRAFEAQPQRLMVAMYKCEILTVNSEALGKLYAVLGKRNAKILEETIKDGTSMFLITAHIPVAESFGLAEEIRKRTSGLASPHIEFSHFEIIEIDPCWEPKTEEELELFGDKADFENQARKYMNEVRKRKGLFVREKIVEHSEKQRTLVKD